MKNGMATPAANADNVPTNISSLSSLSEYLNKARKGTGFADGFLISYFSFSFGIRFSCKSF